MSTNLQVLLFTLVSSALFGTWLNPPAPFTKKDILRSLESVSLEPISSTGQKHLVIGFNTNLDIVIPNGPDFLRTLPGVEEFALEQDVNVVTSPKEFGQVFSHHFSTSAAGERAITNETLWNDILVQIDRFSSDDEAKLGGNAAIMAQAVSKLYTNVQVSLIGMAGKRITGKLHSNIKVFAGPERKLSIGGMTTFQTSYDEIHLILEYPTNSKFNTYKAQRANRFIVSRDFSNGAVAALETVNQFKYTQVDALVVAGLHIMDGMLSKEIRAKRLAEIQLAINDFQQTTTKKIHLEMGSSGDVEFGKEVYKSIQPSSIGLNEQEFFSLCLSFGICTSADKATMASSTPPVLKVQESIVSLFELSPKLDRIHFHCYSYHVIAQRNPSVSTNWPNPRKAVATGSLIATERACANRVQSLHGNQLTLSVNAVKVKNDSGNVVSISINPENVVVQFSLNKVDFYLAPVVACTIPKQTVGLGDYISASALAIQL